MRRNNQTDINTPEHYDELFYGPRSKEMLATGDLLQKLRALNFGGRVLDIGCGPGRYFPAFNGSEIYGTELSEKATIEALSYYPYARIEKWYAGNPLPYPDNYFELVWCGEFLEHVEHPQQVVDEVIRVLKPGRKALFTTPIGEHAKCPEHLWFFDLSDIIGFFKDKCHAVISEEGNLSPKGSRRFRPSRFHALITKYT